MTLQEILKSQGLSDEQIKTITGEMKQNKVYTAGEENLDIRYKDLQTKFEGKDKEHQEASALIEQLKKDNAGNEALQGKITEYETKMTALQSELEQTKVDAALKVALLEAKVVDVDYLTFKIKEKGEIKLTEDGKVKGIEDTITAMKTQYPSQFSSESKKKIDENKLPGSDEQRNDMTKADLLKKSYNERLKIYQENPEAFNQIMNS